MSTSALIARRSTGSALIMRGRLSQVSFGALIQMLEGEQVTGRLVLPQGHVELRDGMLVGASCGALTGCSAVIQLFLGTSGWFEVHAIQPAASTPIGRADHLTLVACQLLDQWARVRAKVLAPVADPEPGPLGALAARLDGRRTLYEAAQLAGIAVVDLALAIDGRLRGGDWHEVAQERPDVVSRVMAAAQPQEEDEPTSAEATLEAENAHLRTLVEELRAQLREAGGGQPSDLQRLVVELRARVTAAVDASYHDVELW